MNSNFNEELELEILEQKIKEAQLNNLPIDKFVLRQIEILQYTIDTFMKRMAGEDRLNDIQVVEIEIQQYAVMRELAKKINLKTDKYEKHINEIKKRIFGDGDIDKIFK